MKFFIILLSVQFSVTTVNGTDSIFIGSRVTLYPGKANENSKCKILTVGMRPSGIIGTWQIVNTNNGNIIYELSDQHGKSLLHLLKLDDNVLVFLDSDRKLLVGGEDFSYTLNRVK